MASTITTSVVTGGSNAHATTVSEVNAFRTDFSTPGVIGTTTSTAGVAPATGSFAVNAQASPAMFVDVTAGSANITATPAGQVSQVIRANMVANYTSYAISANASGSTKYDWVYLSVDATKANNPASDASDVTALFTSRSSSNTTDNGSPPTYGVLLAVVTVANGASSISNANVSDQRYGASLVTSTNSSFDFDYVRSGCVWSGDSYASTLNASMTSGYIRISGKTLRVPAVSARAFTASKDTYVDLSDNGDGTAAFTYTANTTNTASPALAANAIRIAIIVAGASSIAAATSVNQGQETMVLPIISSVPMAVTDSLGNLICSRSSVQTTLGYRQVITSPTGTTIAQVTGLSAPVVIPTTRKVKITAILPSVQNTGTNSNSATIWDGAVSGGTQLGASTAAVPTATGAVNLTFSVVKTLSAGLHTINIGVAGTSGTWTVVGALTTPSALLIELI